MDVRQLAFLAGQPSAAVIPRERFMGMPKRGLAFLLANVMFWQPMWAQADGIVVSAPGTSLDRAGNGVPIVNITTPNATGLSHNQFHDYNVTLQGLILNNGSTQTSATQLGGYIVGNPNLKNSGSAQTILNEVNGGSPSQLNGYTEVAGQSARVIVANPYGISCNGCGFINTPRVTLTTGKPVLDNGRLDHFQVDQGSVSIDGAGINATNVDRFEIITRSAKINAQIQANNLTIVAGRNDVNADTLNATARANYGSAKPELAIDSSALGGMYAGAIKLVGTEAGVGVKLDGKLIASGGDIQLDANGQLSLADTSAANGAVNIKAASLNAQGPVYAGTTLNVQTQGDLSNQQSLAARDSINLSAGGQLTNNNVIEAGVNADTSRNASGDVNLSAQNFNNSGKSVIASRNLTVSTAQTLTNQGGTLSAQNRTQVTAGTLDNQNKGRVLSSGSLSVTANQLLNAQGGLLNSVGSLDTHAGYLNNNSGELSSLDTLTVQVASLDNVAGLVSAGKALSITSDAGVNNQGGKLTSLSTLNLKAGQVDNSQGGKIASNQALTASVTGLDQHNGGQLTSSSGLTLNLNQGQLNNQGGLINAPLLVLNNLKDVGNQNGEISSTQAFTLAARNLDNSNGKLISNQGLTLRVDQALSNINGLISAAGLDARAGSLDNTDGVFTSTTGLSLTLDGALNNHAGEVSSATSTTLKAASLDNSDGQVTGDVALNIGLIGALNNQNGVLGSGKTVSISAASLDNSHDGSLVSDDSLTARIGGLFDNQNGNLSAKGVVDLKTGSLDNRNGSLIGKDRLTLQSDTLDNRTGKVRADKDLQLNVGQLDNREQGLLNSQAAINFNGTRLDNRGGLLSAVGPVRLDAASIDNSGGRLSSKSDLIANIGQLTNQKGELVAQGTLTLTGKGLDNRNGGLVGATKALKLSVDEVDNRSGEISSAVDVSIEGQSLNNSDNGKVLAGTDLGLKVAQIINQTTGLLFSKGATTVQGKSLDNSGGSLVSQQGLDIRLDQALSNLKGLISSEGTLNVSAASLDSTNGSLSSAGALTVTTTGALINTSGSITTDGGLTLSSQSLNNSQNGLLSGKSTTRVTTGTFDNTQGGRLISGDTLDLTATQVSNGVASRIASDKALTASVTGFDQQGGELFSKTSLSLDLNQGQLNNRNGLINAPLLMLKNLKDVNNQGGEISSAQAFTLAAQNLDNSNGKLISNQGLTLRIDQALASVKGLISAQTLDLHSASLDNSSGLVSSHGTLGLTVQNQLVNQGGTLIADGDMQLNADNLDNTNGQIAGKSQVTANIATLNNQGGQLIATGGLQLTGTSLDNRLGGLVGATNALQLTVGAVDNRGGELSSKADVSLTGSTLDNSDGGQVLADGALTLTVDRVINRAKGLLSGKAGLNLTGSNLDNSGGSLTTQQNLSAELAGSLDNSQGLLSAEGTLGVKAASLTNTSGSVSSAGALTLTTTGAVSNQGGEIVTDAGLTLNSASLDNRNKGSISGKGAVLVATGAFDNSHAGRLSSGDSLNLTATQLTNQDGGRIASTAALTASVTGLDQQGGQLFSNTSLDLDLNHGQLNNQNGLINAPLLMLKNLKDVSNQSGEISSAQAFTVAADSLDNSNGKLLSNQGLTLRINQALTNVKGMIAAAALDVRAASLDNNGGTLTSRADLNLNVDGQLTNQNQGLINATTDLNINSSGLNNQGGSLLGSAIAIDLGAATGDLNNSAGLITTAGTLSINHLRDLTNQGGEISSNQSINLSARALDNSAGKLISNNRLTVNAANVLNQGGLVSGWQGLSLNASSLDNRNNGTLSSRSGDVGVTVSGAILNSGAGALVSQKALIVSAASLDNSNGGILSSGSGQTLTVSGLLNNAQGGLIDSGATLAIQAMTLGNASGTVNAQQALSFTGTTLDNSGGNLVGNGAVTLDLLGALTNTNGKIASAGPLLVQRSSQINNQGGQLASQGLMTLLTGGLDNRNRGTVAANDQLTLTTGGALQNSADGLIYSQNGGLQVQAASLDNAKGTLQSQGALNLTVGGDIDNQSGRILAKTGDLSISAGNLDNRGGVLASLQGAFTAHLTGVLKNGYDLNNNRQGGITQAQRLNLTALGGIDNYGGRISAQTGDAVIATGAGNFDNRNGGLYAKGQVNVTGNNFDNSGDNDGQIAGNQITLNLNGALNNRLGIIESDTTLAIKAARLDNQTGQLRALGTSGKTDFQIGGLFDNRNGTLETANTDLSLAVGGFLNGGGSLLHVGTGTFDISTANVTGAGGSIVTRGGLTLNADSWTNSSVIQAGRLNVNVNNFVQTASGQLLASNSFVGTGGNWYNDGLIASDGSMSLALGGSYGGNGRTSSLGNMTLSANQLTLNSATTIAGGGDTTINVGGMLTNQGRLTSNANLNVSAGGVNNYGTLGAGKDLTLTTGALLNSGGLISSGGDMRLLVSSFTNSYAQVYGLGNVLVGRDPQQGKADLLDNRSGNIESAQNLTINALTVNNVRDVLQYGEHEKTSVTITRLPCATIPGPGCDARRKGRVNGHWQIDEVDSLKVTASSDASGLTSGADMLINAQTLNNTSSTIAATGNLTANAATINNTGLQAGEIHTVRTYWNYVDQIFGAVDAAAAFTAKNSPTPSDTVEADLSNFIGLMGGGKLTESQVTTNPGGKTYDSIIQAGGNVSLNAAQNLNNSVVRSYYNYVTAGHTNTDTGAGNAYSTPIRINSQLRPDLAQQQVNPLALPGFSLPTGQNGMFRLSGQGTSTPAASGPQSWTMGGASLGAAQRQQALPASQAREIQIGNIAQASATSVELIAAARQAANTDTSASAINAAVPGADPASGAVLPGRSATNAAISQAAPVVGQSTRPSAFTVNRVQGLPTRTVPSNPQKYLIETNPVLTDLKQFMSSDYLLANLGYDPDKSAKRLGDGLYEQKLIQQAVVSRTGQRFIDGQTSDAALFKYLMNNAVASKQQLNLSLGVSLTSEQVAALTHDIVWMENAEVNGERVLVPVLYLANANNRLAANGALIQGSDVTLIAGNDLNNAGTLRASNNLSAKAGNDVINTGLIEAGNRLDLLAGNNIINKSGGIIAGRDVSLTAVNGNVINQRDVTGLDSSIGGTRQHRDYLDNAARIEASNDLSIVAGRDIKNTGGVLQSGRDMEMSAGRDVSINSIQERTTDARGSSFLNQQITQHGAEVTAGRDLSISAGRDISAIASRLDAKRDIALQSEGDITLASAADESTYASRSKKTTLETHRVTQQSTEVNAGRDISIDAGKDLAIIASRIKGGADISLDAGQDITIASDKDESSYYYTKKSKGSFGRSSSKQQESYDSTNVASVIDAGHDLTVNTSKDAQGGVSLDGGRDVSIIGSQLKAGNDLILGATNDVAVLSGVEEHGSYSKTTKSGFLGLSKSGKSQLKTTATQVGSELSAGNDAVVVAGNDVRLRASEVTAKNDAELRAGLIKETGDINLVSANDSAYSLTTEYKKKAGLSFKDTVGLFAGTPGLGADITLNAAKKAGNEAISSTSVGSQVSADRDATLNAERDINILGSGVSAGRTVTLGAGRDVNVVAGSSQQQNNSWETNKSYGIKQNIDNNGFTTFVGNETRKERNDRITQTAAASQIDAGQDIKVKAGRDVNQQGSDLQAERNITLQAGRDINIDAAGEKTVDTHSESVKRNGTTTTVAYNLGKTMDTLSGSGKGDDGVSKGSSVLKSVDALGQFFSGPTFDGHAGLSSASQTVTQTSDTNRPSSLSAGNDISLVAGNDVNVRGSQFNAGRDINVAGKDITFDVARGADTSDGHGTQSKGGLKGGTTGGFKIGVGVSNAGTKDESNRGTSTPAQLNAGRDINLDAKDDLNLIGTQANAERNIDLKAGNDLNIRAAENASNSESSRRSWGAEGGLMAGKDGFGIYGSANIGLGKLEREAVKQQEAYLYAGNRLGFDSGRDTTIAGAKLRGDEVIGDVGRNLTVSSALDTGKVSGKELDLTVTGSFSGASGSIGYGQTTGKTNWVESQTSISAKDKLDIHTENHTQIDGAVLASDSGKLKLDTNTLGFRDIAGKDKEHGYYLNVSGSYNFDSGGKDQAGTDQAGKKKDGDSKSSWAVEGYNYNKDREQIVRATVGAGDIVVRDDKATGKDSTAGLNRDLDKAYEITRDEEHRTDLYVSSSSVDALKNTEQTVKNWKDSVVNFKENQKAQAVAVVNALNAIKGEIQAARVDLSEVPEVARKQLGDERALAVSKNLVRRGLDPLDAEQLQPQTMSKLAEWADDMAKYNAKMESCESTGTCQKPPSSPATSTDYKLGDPVLLGDTNIDDSPKTMGEVALRSSRKLKAYIDSLPVEEAQIAMMGAQAIMGPGKALVSIAGNALLRYTVGDKVDELKEKVAIGATAALTDREKDEVAKTHAEEKELYKSPDRDLTQLNGDSYVLTAEWLIDIAMGGVKSLAGKAYSVAAMGAGKGKTTPARVEPGNTQTKGGFLKEAASRLGYDRRIPPQKAPFDSHGQPVFSNGKEFISPDVDGHNVSDGWKVFNRKGQRIGTYDKDLNRI